MEEKKINIYVDTSTLEAYRAMIFAKEAHKDQKRKYTNEPYAVHLAEVAGIVSTIYGAGHAKISIAVAWLHDVLEDCAVTVEDLNQRFSKPVVEGVVALSDLEEGSRDTRKRLSRERLAKQPKWIQDIKVCDLISNTHSIVMHNPEFAKVYLKEKTLLLDCLTKADERLIKIARGQCE